MVDKTTEGQSGKPDADRKDQPETSDTPRKSLSALLAEWEEKDKVDSNAKPEPRGKGETSADDLAKRLEAIEGALTKTNYQADMKSVVATVKGDLQVDEGFVESWINRKADSDPRLVELWEQRDSRKAQFQEAIKALQPEFKEYVEQLTKQLLPQKDEEPEKGRKADRGLAAAVRSAREAAPGATGYDAVNWAGLAEHEFALKKAEVFKAAKEGRL
jgi:hypothetical protein